MSIPALSAGTFVSALPASAQSTASWLNDRLNVTYLQLNHPEHNSKLCDRPEWADKEYRQAYLEASIEQGIAWQIRSNRNYRGWTQEYLGSLIGTSQSGVSRLEDPEYGGQSLQTLVELAHAFDCALLVKLVPYSTLAEDSLDLRPENMFAAGYEDEMKEGGHV